MRREHDTRIERINSEGSFRLVCSCGHRDYFGTSFRNGETLDDTVSRAKRYAVRHVEEKEGGT